MITEKEIQYRLRVYLMDSQQMICPNFSMPGWWECDLFSITKKEMVQEHEIKLTRKDFQKDAKKHKYINRVWVHGQGYVGEHVTKHELLAKRSEDGPNRFWFVCPAGLLKESEIPEWAGLKEFSKEGDDAVQIVKVKNAPVLHKKRVSHKVRNKAGQIFYFRYWDKINQLERIKESMGGHHLHCDERNTGVCDCNFGKWGVIL